MRFSIRASCIGILFLIAVSAKGQFLQFSDPGGPESRPETPKERLEREIAEAPWRLGPLRAAPLVGIRDVAYVRDLLGGTGRSDVTVTAGAGVRAYLHTGRKVAWIGQVVPEYVWWQNAEDARRLNLSYGIETLGLFNRLTVDAAFSRLEQQRILTPEVTLPVNAGSDRGRLDAELEATGKLFPFILARWNRQEGLVDDRDDPRIETLQLLDREERVARGGVRWRPRTGWTIGLAVERSEVDFDRAELDSSNEGTAPVLELVVDRRQLFFSADLAARSLTAREGSRFVDFDGVTGVVSLNLWPEARTQLWIYANRNLVYSLTPEYPYLDDERIGISAGTGFGRRIFVRGYVETGSNDYVAAPSAARRRDDLVAFGGSVRFSATNHLSLVLQAARIDFDSNLLGNDRSYTSGGLTVALRGNLMGTDL
jgi:hypothetical protein